MIQAPQALWKGRFAWSWPRLRWLFGGRRARNAIEMCALRFNYLPSRFRRQGTLHSIYTIDSIWERCEQRFYAVRCRDGASRTLVHDLRYNTWHMLERGTAWQAHAS
jgi:hypothetical protein